MKFLRALWHRVIRNHHAGTWIENRCGVAHHVCACGFVTPARKLGPKLDLPKDKYDFDKAVRSRRLSLALEADLRRLACRRADAAVPDTFGELHRFDADRRSAR